MPSLPTAACATLGAILLSASGARAATDAPLGVTTPGPFRGLFLDLPLADAGPRLRTGLDLRWSLANEWSKPTAVTRGGRTVRLQEDAQADVVQASLTLPLRRFTAAPFARRLSTTLELRAVALWGGWTDRPIEGWHGLVQSWNFERQLYPRDDVNVSLAEDGGRTFGDVRSERVALGDLAVRTQLVLVGASPEDDTPPPRAAVALRLDVKLPTGDRGRFGGSGRPDAGLGLAATVRASWLTAHALADVRVIADLPGGLALQPRRFQGGLDVSLVARVLGLALVLEDRISSPLMEAGWKLPADQLEPEATAWYALFRAHNQVSGGIRAGDVTVFFSEDFTIGWRLPNDPGPRWFYDSNAPDVVVGLSWARAW
jgi:hypothetical protein